MVAEASLQWGSAPTTFLTPAPLAHVSHVPWLHFPIFHVIFGMARPTRCCPMQVPLALTGGSGTCGQENTSGSHSVVPGNAWGKRI